MENMKHRSTDCLMFSLPCREGMEVNSWEKEVTDYYKHRIEETAVCRLTVFLSLFAVFPYFLYKFRWGTSF